MMRKQVVIRHYIDNPFPVTRPDGVTLEDERCYCGHKRSEHFDSYAWGHGKCAWDTCKCQKFTWRAFIKKGEKL
jgi:hypothetical protein